METGIKVLRVGEREHGRPRTELAPGDLFADRYQIEGLLGRGGMGAVYRARDLSLGEGIALKVLSLGADPPPLAVLRFRQEVKLARRVTHPNVARVYDIGEHEGLIFLTMELIEGITLRALLASEHRLTPLRAARIGQEIAGALRAAHEAGVIHRDIKPTNILLDPSGKVVLTDFGIARSATDASELTQGVIGTPSYMAPEQLEGEAVDPRTDLYALGLCLYEMLTGNRAEKRLGKLAEDLRRTGTPEALITLTQSCLRRETEARPQSAAEVERALAEVLAAPTAPTLKERRPEAPPEAPGTLVDAPTAAAEASSLTSSGPRVGPRPFVLAVLPFLFTGEQESAHLGVALADEIVDALSYMGRRSVLGTRSTAKYQRNCDLRPMRDDLGASAALTGSVQKSASQVRIKVRLVNTEDNTQIWSISHECAVADLFALQSVLAQQIAEELRVALITLRYRGDAPDEVIQRYAGACARLRGFEYTAAVAAAQEFERCIEVAPEFTPALAGHAMACARAWFFDPGNANTPDWERVATASAALVKERAPELAESHLAAAMIALQSGEHASGVRSLANALAIAPTCPEAYLAYGEIEYESGQLDAGLEHIKRAHALAPDLPHADVLLARHHALAGRFAACDAILAKLEEQGSAGMAQASMMRARAAAWRGDREVLRWFAGGNHAKHLRIWDFVKLYAEAALGVLAPEEVERCFASLNGSVRNARRMTALTQLTAEVFAFRGERDATMFQLFQAASQSLIDLTWLDLCPLFADIRPLPDFQAVRQRVRLRVGAIWQP